MFAFEYLILHLAYVFELLIFHNEHLFDRTGRLVYSHLITINFVDSLLWYLYFSDLYFIPYFFNCIFGNESHFANLFSVLVGFHLLLTLLWIILSTLHQFVNESQVHSPIQYLSQLQQLLLRSDKERVVDEIYLERRAAHSLHLIHPPTLTIQHHEVSLTADIQDSPLRIKLNFNYGVDFSLFRHGVDNQMVSYFFQKQQLIVEEIQVKFLDGILVGHIDHLLNFIHHHLDEIPQSLTLQFFLVQMIVVIFKVSGQLDDLPLLKVDDMGERLVKIKLGFLLIILFDNSLQFLGTQIDHQYSVSDVQNVHVRFIRRKLEFLIPHSIVLHSVV